MVCTKMLLFLVEIAVQEILFGHDVLAQTLLDQWITAGVGGGGCERGPFPWPWLSLGEREGGAFRQNMYQECQTLLCKQVRQQQEEVGGGASTTRDASSSRAAQEIDMITMFDVLSVLEYRRVLKGTTCKGHLSQQPSRGKSPSRTPRKRDEGNVHPRPQE